VDAKETPRIISGHRGIVNNPSRPNSQLENYATDSLKDLLNTLLLMALYIRTPIQWQIYASLVHERTGGL
jgi:hypothetical protein